MTTTTTAPRRPRRIPLWAWHLNAWLDSGRKGPRPDDAPRRTPPWFWTWRHWHLRRARHAGLSAWQKHHRRVLLARQAIRDKVVDHLEWGATATVSPRVHYTMDARRDDWLVDDAPTGLPMYTDCSGWDTQAAYAAGAPDPNGLDYRYLGYTGTTLAFAYAHGTVTTDLRLAAAGDNIVMGEGTGVHEFGVVKADPVHGNPWVSSHGHEGVQIIRALDDPRTPKRVCKVLL